MIFALGVLFLSIIIWCLVDVIERQNNRLIANIVQYARENALVPSDYSTYLMKQHKNILDHFLVLEAESKPFLNLLGESEKYAFAILYFYQEDLLTNQCVLEPEVQFQGVFEHFEIHRKEYETQLNDLNVTGIDKNIILLIFIRMALFRKDKLAIEAVGDYYQFTLKDYDIAYIWFSEFSDDDHFAYRCFQLDLKNKTTEYTGDELNMLFFRQFLILHLRNYHIYVDHWKEVFVHPESVMLRLSETS